MGNRMRRRDVVLGALFGGMLAGAAGRRPRADPSGPSVEEIQRAAEEWRAKALASFPYERIETTGTAALATWRRLKAEGRGVPVVIGDDDHVVQLMDGFAMLAGGMDSILSKDQITTNARKTLELAGKLHHPDDLLRLRERESADADAFLKDLLRRDANPQLPTVTLQNADGSSRVLTPAEVLDQMIADHEPPVGSWPTEEPAVTPDNLGLTVALEMFRDPLHKVSIALIPADDATEIPAYLNLGNWNAMPAPEYHVAALRSWRDRYGAELVGLNFDTFNLQVSRPPASRNEALELAREQYEYCADIVDQGVGSLSALAANLKVDRWWYFWWD